MTLHLTEEDITTARPDEGVGGKRKRCLVETALRRMYPGAGVLADLAVVTIIENGVCKRYEIDDELANVMLDWDLNRYKKIMIGMHVLACIDETGPCCNWIDLA